MKTVYRMTIVLLALLALPLVALAQEGQGGDETYTDPQGLYTVPIPTNWTATESEDGSYVLFTDPDEKILIYATAVEAADDLAGLMNEFIKKVAPDFDLEVRTTNDVSDPALLQGFERSLSIVYDTPLTRVVVADASVFEGIAYLSYLDADVATLQRRSAQLTYLSTGFKVTAMEQTDLTGVEALPITEEMLAQLEAFIEKALELSEVPGLSVAVVQDGEIVYAKGFGVTEMGGSDPVTSDTYMLIGSITKTMTTMVMATLVDDGLMDWDTPVIDILPTFQVADPDITQQLTMSNLVCACTGVPRRDFELIFNAKNLTAEDIVEQLATFEFFTDFGETFQYSNQMVATGGYVAALAAGASYDNLYEGYVQMMQARIFDPIGLERTTFSFEQVTADGDYATPHGATLDSEYVVVPLEIESGFLRAIAPAGGVWSTANDMAQYIITALNDGVAPDGTQVVSADNLNMTWQPQVAISADLSYGLGWVIENYRGVRVLWHDGGTLGFASQMAFVPDAGVGVIVLSNGQGAQVVTQSIRERLLELVFDQEPKIEAQLDSIYGKPDASESVDRYGVLDPDAVEPFLGAWTNDALGAVTLVLEDDQLILDAGEWRTELRPYLDESGEFLFYITYSAPLAGVDVHLNTADDGSPALVVGSGVTEYPFTRAG